MFCEKVSDSLYVMDKVEDMASPDEKREHWDTYKDLVAAGYKVKLVSGGAAAAQQVAATHKAKASKAKAAGKKSSKHGKKPIAYFEIATQMLPEYFDWDDTELQALGDVAAMLGVMLARLDAVDGCEVDQAYGNLHDKDTHELWNEATGDYDIVPKEVHPHLIFHFATGKGLTLPDIAEALGVAENLIDKPKRGQKWDGALAYQIHAKDADKYPYDPHNVVTARGEDYVEVWRKNKASWERGRAVKSRKMATAPVSVDYLEEKILNGEITEQQILINDDYFAIYGRNSVRLDTAFKNREAREAALALKAFEENEYSPSIFYIFGADGGEGKTCAILGLVKWLQHYLGWRVDEPSDEHPGDHLTGAEILFLDDCEAASMSPKQWLGLFDEKRAVKASARYKDKPKQKARLILILSNERPLDFFASISSIHGSSSSMNKFFRRLQRYIRVIHPNDYGYMNWFLQQPVWTDEYTERALGGESYGLRWRFENTDADMVYSPYGAMEQIARFVDERNYGIISKRPDADEVFAALSDYVYREYHPGGIDVRDIPPLPERKLLPDKTSWTQQQRHHKELEALREHERSVEKMELRAVAYREYAEWLFEFRVRENEGTVPDAWRQGTEGVNAVIVDGGAVGIRNAAEAEPLTFEQWSLRFGSEGA